MKAYKDGRVIEFNECDTAIKRLCASGWSMKAPVKKKAKKAAK